MKKLLAIAALTFGLATPAVAMDVTVCGGSEGGFYNGIANNIAAQLKRESKGDIDPEVVETNGSVDNIEYYKDGDCDIILAQGDALNLYDLGSNNDMFAAHQETAYWVYNKEFGIEDLEDMEGSKEFRVAIVEGSGSDVTLNSFAKEDKGYQPNYDQAVLAFDSYDAVSIVANGYYNQNGEKVKVAGTLLVTRAGVISDEIVQDFKGKIAVGELTDGDFNDAKDALGQRLYNTCGIEKKHTKGLDRASWGSQDTICMSAFVVANRAMFDDIEDRKDQRNLQRAVKKAINKALRGLN